jgi:hypothetical protein
MSLIVPELGWTASGGFAGVNETTESVVETAAIFDSKLLYFDIRKLQNSVTLFAAIYLSNKRNFQVRHVKASRLVVCLAAQ